MSVVEAGEDSPWTKRAGLTAVAAAVALFQFSLTYQAYQRGGPGAITDQVIYTYLAVALLIGSATGTIRSRRFNTAFSGVGGLLVAGLVALDPRVVYVLGLGLFAAGFVYYGNVARSD
ncbi:hypothetical protein [Haloarcula halophila]|uniref:hypothetical protein n=1 Tax=Haloarcula TaxID=2237 RepID=UPI0023E40919|nr:hypothetical protein [Halomicroarcula sp. DFY41]